MLAGAAGLRLWDQNFGSADRPHRAMLLAPMIAVIDPCILSQAGKAADRGQKDLNPTCTGPEGSAAELVESTLSALAPGGTPSSPYVLGYTLPVPLLQLFRPDAGGWSIDHDRVARVVRTVQGTNRPLILYLFATHFAADAPIEAALATNPANLAHTRDGPLAEDTFYDSKIYNWTFASTENEITARRVQAIEALLQEICKLPQHDIAKIRGVTLLGELHHLFPGFQTGMGFNPPYRVSDYSAPSVAGFHAYLKREFKTTKLLNMVLGTEFKSFEEVVPPSRDIRSEPLKNYLEHIDSFAQGSLPIAGWVHTKPDEAGAQPWVHIYRNGEFVGKTPVRLSRQDVLEVHPEFGDANAGWRMDMDFTRLPLGTYHIDVFLDRGKGTLERLGTRQIAIMDRHQRTPQELPQKELPPHQPADPSLQFHLEYPSERSSYFFNPLVPLWHAYRAEQVTRYLQYFERVVAQTCLAQTPHYTHQIIPFTNPSWDANKFAIQASLQPLPKLRLGVSLYGEASYGTSYANWYGPSGHKGYGVTEFHPLKRMDSAALGRTLADHAARGAEFLSFFLEPRWHGQLIQRGHNLFSFDPASTQFGSDVLYRSMQQVLDPAQTGPKETPRPAPAPSPVRP